MQKFIYTFALSRVMYSSEDDGSEYGYYVTFTFPQPIVIDGVYGGYGAQVVQSGAHGLEWVVRLCGAGTCPASRRDLGRSGGSSETDQALQVHGTRLGPLRLGEAATSLMEVPYLCETHGEREARLVSLISPPLLPPGPPPMPPSSPPPLSPPMPLTPPHHTYDIVPTYTDSYEGSDSKSLPPNTGHSTGHSTDHAAAIGAFAPPPDWGAGPGGVPGDGPGDGQVHADDAGASSLRERDSLPPRGVMGELLPQVKSSQVKSSQQAAMGGSGSAVAMASVGWVLLLLLVVLVVMLGLWLGKIALERDWWLGRWRDCRRGGAVLPSSDTARRGKVETMRRRSSSRRSARSESQEEVAMLVACSLEVSP